MNQMAGVFENNTGRLGDVQVLLLRAHIDLCKKRSFVASFCSLDCLLCALDANSTKEAEHVATVKSTCFDSSV